MIATEREQIKKAYAYDPIALDFNLYLITDRSRTGEKPLHQAVEEALKGGVRAIQLREKDLGTRQLLRLAYEIRELTLKYDARLFINDRVDIAIAVEADGVHLGQKSIPPYAIRRLSSSLIVGVSTHTIKEAIKAERDGADFITYGPIFPTRSKSGIMDPLGLQSIVEVKSKVSLPVFALGGITLDNFKSAMDIGADGVALISGIFEAKDVRQTAGKFARQLS